jgi:hypothetical protein
LLRDRIRSLVSLVHVPFMKHILGFEARVQHRVFREPKREDARAR